MSQSSANQSAHIFVLSTTVLWIFFIPSFILYSFHLKFPLFGNELNTWGYTGKGRSKHSIIIGAKSSQHRKTDREKTCKEKNKFKLRVFKLMSLTGNQSTRRRTNSPTPTRQRIKSSRDVGELVVNPIQLIRS